MRRLIPSALWVVAALNAPLRAETEEAFVARVTEAWNSKDVGKILALYDKKSAEDPEFRKKQAAALEWEFQNWRLESASLVPFMPGDGAPRIMPGQIYFSSSKWKSLVMRKVSDGEGALRTGSRVQPVVQNGDGTFAFVSSEVKSFEWNGPELDRFNVTVSYSLAANPPPVVVVFEGCGRISWSKMDCGSFGFRAHRIHQVIIPTVGENASATIEITRNEEAKAFVTKTVDASKGAIVPIELP